MSSTIEVDIAVLGGGAAGLGAAREARRRGASTAIVVDGPLGGDCTFTGCVPSKTFIESARAGLTAPAALDRVRSVVAAIAATESAEVVRGEGVTVIEGEGRLVAGRRIEVDGHTVVARRALIVAGGSRPLLPPVDGLDRIEPLTSDSLWSLTVLPRSMVVAGGGAIGCELGQALARFGVDVTIVELAERVLPGEEPAASAVVARALEADGVGLRVGVGIGSVAPCRGGGIEARLDDGSVVAAERLLVAVGRAPNTDRGGLVDAGLALDRRGFVAVDRHLTTSISGVYAAGDINGLAMFSHAADHMGRLAAANALRRLRRAAFDRSEIPSVTFTTPEVASVGLSEADAAQRYGDAKVAELPLEAHDRAVAAGRTDGYLKLIAAPNPVLGHAGGGRLVGATVVADRAGEVLAELALAMKVRAFVGRLAMTVHPYPTWSYAVAKTAAQFFTEVEGRSARPAREGPAPGFTPTVG